MNLENVLSEISQLQKDKYLCFLLHEVPSQIHRNTKQNAGYQELFEGTGEIGNCLMGREFYYGMMKKFWRWMVVMFGPLCECK